MKRVLLCALFALLTVSCAAQPALESMITVTGPANTAEPTSLPSTLQETHDVLVNFLTLLHHRKYEEAAALYGGDYEELQVFNPQIDPADHVALWTWACDNQLLQCLEVRSATFKTQIGDSYVFQVEFSNPDGSLFVLGPCCGANETEMPPVLQFEYTVKRDAHMSFVVINMPPYVP